MPVLTFPDISPDKMRWGILANTQDHTSPLTASSQTIELPAPRWTCDLSYFRRPVEQAAPLQAFLSQLKGTAGRFNLWNFQRPSPRGTAAGTPRVNGASQVGQSLILDGFTALTTFKVGDFFAVNSEIKMVSADVAANGSGQMTVTFSPPLRASPADNALITLVKPTAIFKLRENSNYWDDMDGVATDFQISCIETFEVA